MAISRTHVNALVDDDGSNTVGTLWNKARVTEIYDDIDALVTNWASYTPTWTNLSVGNGTVTAKWSRSNKTIHVNVSLIFGSTTAISGSVSVSLPANNTALIASQVLGDFGMLDSSASGLYRGMALLGSATTAVLYTGATTLSGVNATSPFTWATSDQMFIRLCYQEA